MSALNPRSALERASDLIKQQQEGLAPWGIGEPELQAHVECTDVRVVTPGATSGELLHMLSSLERRSDR